MAALGLTAAQAKAKLALYGLKAKIIDLETPDFEPGLCIYQDPAAGSEVEIGSVVEITVARGAARPPRPRRRRPPPPRRRRHDHRPPPTSAASTDASAEPSGRAVPADGLLQSG